ncbi:MAG: Ycf66 family protein [Cyanobacteria bacterium P01_D01_bin.56]
MNFGTPVPLLVGLILILGAVGLFFLDKLKPGYERSSDKVYSILLLLSGIFLLAHLNMELLASFQQVMLVGMLTTLIINDISKRDSNRTRPAEREAPPRRYEERPRRVYRAELDDWDGPGPGQPRIPSDRYRDGYGDQYQSRPLEPQRPPYEDRRPPARLQPGQQPPGRPPERSSNSYGNTSYIDNHPPGPGRPDARPKVQDSFYSNPRYDGGSPPNNRPQRPPQGPPDQPTVPSGNGAGHSLGGLPNSSDDFQPRGERPPLNVKPRPQGANEDSYTDFRPAAPSDGGDSGPYPDSPPPQPPANY